MGIRTALRNWLLGGEQPRRRNYGAAYAGAQVTRLTADWWGPQITSVEATRQSLPMLRRRSRDLERNNDYAQRFLRMAETNIAGPQGVRLQVRARNPNGMLDTQGNDIVEMHWRRWGRRGLCTVDGRLSWADVNRLAVRYLARDGEALVRLVRSRRNPYGLTLAFIDPERLDHDYNEDLRDGRRVYMGVEVDQSFRPIAYHIRRYDPQFARNVRDRVSADEIVHVYLVDYEDQVRGVPWMHSAMARLQMLGAYEEAELVAARISAAKMGFFESEDGSQIPADAEQDGEAVIDAEPGTFRTLPSGYKFNAFDPQHPTTAFADFEKAILRGIASGFGVSYVGLANDLEGVNYSSIRQGALDERDMWRMLQQHLIGALCAPVYENWLNSALGSGQLGMPPERFDKFSQVVWQPRGWQWVDPGKEVAAQVEAIGHGLKSRSEVLAEQGRDFEEVIRQLAEESRLAAEYGVPLWTPKEMANAGQDQDDQDEEV